MNHLNCDAAGQPDKLSQASASSQETRKVPLLLIHLLLLAFLCSLTASQAQEPIHFTVNLTRSRTEFSGVGTLTLSGNILSYKILLPQIGPWTIIASRHPYDRFDRRPESFILAECVGTNSGMVSNPICLSHGDLPITDFLISGLLSGLWYITAVFKLSSDPESWIVLRGQILAVDTDRDGVSDYLDACPNTPIGAGVNTSGCSIEQLVPCDEPWRNHGHYLKTLREVTGNYVADGLITERERRAIMRQAAKSDCGKR